MTRIQADWLGSPVCKAVVAALGDDAVRFVGGAVRDTIVGREIKDVDAATRWQPEVSMAKLRASGLSVIPTGIKHGTVTAMLDGAGVEVTTLREDVETDGRHATVAFTNDWQADAARRDFTMNALYLSVDGTLYDPFGGIEDLHAGRVRFIGDARKRIQEDALRILRFFRFHAHYGKDGLDAEGLAASTALAGMLEGLSAERVRDEVCKLLAAPDPRSTVAAMDEADIWCHTPVVGVDLEGFSALIGAEQALGIDLGIMGRLVGLVGARAASVGRVLKMSNMQVKLLKSIMVGYCGRLPTDAPELRAYLYEHGRDAGLGGLLARPGDATSEMRDIVTDWDIPVFPVRGRDLLARGIEQGPEISATLKRLEQKWIESDFSLSLPELLDSVGERRSR